MSRTDEAMAGDLLRVEGLSKQFTSFSMTRGRERTRAVADVSFVLAPGEALGIVGESGSGKSTLARCILGLEAPDTGSVWFDGVRIDGRHRAAVHRGQIQPVFQNPVSSLNPRRRVGEAVADPLAVHTSMTADQRRAEVARLLELVGLSPTLAGRYPGELSGGQCQRVCIARALALKPKLIVADEATSALDVLIQEQIVTLLAQLRRDLGMAILFVSHNLAVTQRLCDRIAVMRQGAIVESGESGRIVRDPRHPYTQMLIRSVPVLPGLRG